VHRILLFGNSGSGKTTMARALAAEYHLVHLDLDSLAWSTPGVRKPLAESAAEIHAFMAANAEWVIEGCYGDLLEVAMAAATEIRFLNPGTEACIANCRARPWEPEKYPSAEAQDATLEFLLDWVREYEARDDEYSLKRHRQLYAAFPGRKTEITTTRR
jgi:adenylate kinase family enzyme